MPVVKKSTQITQKEKNTLKKVYFDASNPASFGGVHRLAEETKLHPKKVSEWLKNQWAYSLHKPVRKKFLRRKYVSRGINHQWQADLMDMQKYARENNGFRYILIAIDIFSRQAYAMPVKNKQGPEIANAIDLMFQDVRPMYLQTDLGLEFYNSHVRNVLDKYNVELFSVYSENKAALVERLIRTIKERLFRIFTHQGNYRWVDALPKVLSAYNNSYHRGLKDIPSRVNEANETDVWIKQYSKLTKGEDPKFKVGDRVRISKNKRIFDKGYLQNWTDEVFTITSVNTKYSPILYTLKDSNDEDIKGSFYARELQLVTTDDYRIERVIRIKTINGKKQALVKWLGYTEPTWINYDDIHTIH